MGEKDNRFNIPKPEKVTDKTLEATEKQVDKIINEKMVEAVKEEWTAEKLVDEVTKAVSKVFNFDDITDRMANRLLAKFQDMDKTQETKPEDKPVEQPQKIEVAKPVEQEKPKSKGLFGL